MPPKPIHYPPPKAVGGKIQEAEIVGRAMIKESFENWGDYMRILDKIIWKKDGHIELRFCQYYRKPNGGDLDWIFGQGAGHMHPKTLVKLIKKAKEKPDHGDFGDSLNGINV